MALVIGYYSAQPQAGKTTLARHLGATQNWAVESFAHPIKVMEKAFLVEMLGAELAYKVLRNPAYKDDKPIPLIGVTRRHLLQTLGTEWGRLCVADDLWLKRIAGLAGRMPGVSGVSAEVIQVDDMRFQNEYDFVDLRIKIVRDTAYNYAHASEGGLEHITDWDYVIENNGDIAALYSAAALLVRNIKEVHLNG